MTRRLLLGVVLLLFPLGCAEGQKPSPLKRSATTVSPPAEHGEVGQKEKPPAPAEEKPKVEGEEKR
jgi:hypothetical protein